MNVVRILRERASPAGLDGLVTRLAAIERGDGPGRSGTDEHSRIRVDLVHRVLPALAAASLIEWDRRSETVLATDNPSLDDDVLDRLLAADGDAVGALAVLDRPPRQFLLGALRRHGPLTVAELASLVHEYQADRHRQASSRSDRRQVALHHVHLPALCDAGFVCYDSTDRIATYVGHPAVPDQCFDRLARSPRSVC